MDKDQRTHSNKIICPYCEEVHYDEEYDFIIASSHREENEFTCKSCSKTFIVTAIHEVYYSTFKIKCKKHSWERQYDTISNLKFKKDEQTNKMVWEIAPEEEWRKAIYFECKKCDEHKFEYEKLTSEDMERDRKEAQSNLIQYND